MLLILFIFITILFYQPVYTQTSYVPSKLFTSYQIILTNYNNPGTDMNSTAISNPYTVSFKDIHNNINSYAIAYSGHDTPISKADCAFNILVLNSFPTQYHLGLSLYGSTTFAQIQFFLLLIGNEANNIMQLVTLNETCDLPSTPTVNNYSSTRLYTTALSAPFNGQIFLQSFRLSQQTADNAFRVGVNKTGVTGSQFNFQYYVGRGNRLTEIYYVIIVYRTTALPTNVSSIDFFQSTAYPGVTAHLDSNAPTSTVFSNGYNRFCIIGLEYISILGNGVFKFESNQVSPLNYTQVTPAVVRVELLSFCLLELYDCTTIDSNCLQCNSHTMCSVCTSQYYVQEYPNITAYCQLCSSAITGCDQCTNTSVCEACISPTYILSNVSCQTCSIYITNCLNCTSQTICTGCVNTYGLVNATVCDLCSNMMTGCKTCLDSLICTSCFSGYFLSNSSCLSCNRGVENCNICNSATICLLCNSDSYLGPGNTSCICNVGKIKTSGLCAPVGCSSAYKFSSTICLACNTNLNFYYVNSTYCACKPGYQLVGQSCQLICGDGLVATEACDDGNVLNGDGCSSSCTVETDYSCSGGSLTSKSTCVYIGQITLELTKIMRKADSNTAELIFNLQPNIRALDKMNFSQYAVLSVNGHSITYSVSYDTAGVITVLADYGTNIEGASSTFTLSYNQSLVGLSSKILTFNMVGYNQPLVVTQSASIDNVIIYLSYAVAALTLLQLIFSLFLHKIIGLQTMQIIQIVFFVRYLLANNGPMAVYCMQSLSYINGYNPFASYTNVQNLDGVTMRMSFTKNFIFNVSIQIVLIVVAFVVYFIFKKKTENMKKLGYEMTSLGVEQLKKVIAVEYRAQMAGFILTVYAFYVFCFALLSSLQPNDETEFSLPRLLLIVTLLVFFYATLYLTAQLYLHWKPKYDEEEGLTYKYVTVFLTYHMLMILIIIGAYSVSYGLEIVGGLQLIYIVIMLINRPYFLKSQNVLLIICLFIGLLFTMILIIDQYLSIPEKYMSYSVAVIQGLLLVVNIIAFVRLYIHREYNYKAFKVLHDEEDKQKGKDVFTKNSFKQKQEEQEMKQVRRPAFSERKKLELNTDLDELTKIRSRLREEHRAKIQIDNDNGF